MGRSVCVHRQAQAATSQDGKLMDPERLPGWAWRKARGLTDWARSREYTAETDESGKVTDIGSRAPLARLENWRIEREAAAAVAEVWDL
jgi:hypothetical protein